MTLSQLAERTAKFIMNVKNAQSGVAPFLPDFRAPNTLKERLQQVTAAILQNELASAQDLLVCCEQHLKNAQAAYLRTHLVTNLRRKLEHMDRTIPAQLMSPARQELQTLEEKLGTGRFDLDEVKALFWSVVEKLDKAQKSHDDNRAAQSREHTERVNAAQAENQNRHRIVGHALNEMLADALS